MFWIPSKRTNHGFLLVDLVLDIDKTSWSWVQQIPILDENLFHRKSNVLQSLSIEEKIALILWSKKSSLGFFLVSLPVQPCGIFSAETILLISRKTVNVNFISDVQEVKFSTLRMYVKVSVETLIITQLWVRPESHGRASLHWISTVSLHL